MHLRNISFTHLVKEKKEKIMQEEKKETTQKKILKIPKLLMY